MSHNHYPPFVDEPRLEDDPARHPQETAFLQSIMEDPDDDASRLIFADWLDENGHADKAAFVRLEVELSREPQSSERYAEVRDELVRLDVAIGGHWCRALVRINRLLNCGSAKAKTPVLRFVYECPLRWADLMPRRQPDERHCGKCRKTVHLCATRQEAEEHAVAGHCIAIGSRLALAVQKEHPVPEGPDGYFAEDELVMGEFQPGEDVDPSPTVVLHTPYQRWAKELFARHRKRWWQIWK